MSELSFLPCTPNVLDYVVSRLISIDPEYAPVLHSHLEKAGNLFRDRAESFFGRYDRFIRGQGKTLDFGIDCFQKLRVSVQEERFNFLRTGHYSNQSFDEVNRSIYSDPEIMTAYMNGLVFAQFLWPEQYQRFKFFSETLPLYQSEIRSYLEIGGGHGLYVTEALRQLDAATTFELVDISPSSIELARGVAGDSRVRCQLLNVLEFSEDCQYDFITMGEVLEHVERPRELLQKVHALLSPGGRAYITTPANAPMIDHIYLFENAEQIREMLAECGFAIEHEITKYAVDLPPARCIAAKAALMFGAFVRKARATPQ